MFKILSILYLLAHGGYVAAENGNYSIHAASDGDGRYIFIGSNPDNSSWEWHTAYPPLLRKFKNPGVSTGFGLSFYGITFRPSMYYLEKNNSVFESFPDDYWQESAMNIAGNLSSLPYPVSDGSSSTYFVGLGANGHGWHWNTWRESETSDGWLDIGGDLLGTPVASRSGQFAYDRQNFDVFAISSKHSLVYKNFTINEEDYSAIWKPNVTHWETFDDTKSFKSIGVSRFYSRSSSEPSSAYSLWACNDENQLLHKRWNGSTFSSWEELGGSWTTVPAVIEWKLGQFDVWGKNRTDSQFYFKSYNGTHWNPDGKNWTRAGGPFVTEPAVFSDKKYYYIPLTIYVSGIASNGSLTYQLYPAGEGLHPERGIRVDDWVMAAPDVTKLPNYYYDDVYHNEEL